MKNLFQQLKPKRVTNHSDRMIILCAAVVEENSMTNHILEVFFGLFGGRGTQT